MAGIVMSLTPPSPFSPSASAATPSTALPVRTIPGSYGLPLVGPLSDRLDYFWFQGPETFFKKRMEKHKSTVFRTNIPPSFPFFSANPNIVAVLDTCSFAHLFDMDVVDKRDVLVGDFMPSVGFTGGIRVGAYLDTSEPKHAKVKSFALDVLKRSSSVWVKELESNLSTMWDTIEADLSKSSSVTYFGTLQKFIFNFLTKCLIGVDPTAEISNTGPAVIDVWLGLQLLPTVKIGFLQPLEEIFLHSFAYPSFLVSGGYNKLYNFILENGKEVVKRGQVEFGLSQEETIHNLLFILGFNAYGGFSIFIPTLFGVIFSDANLQKRIVDEVRKLGGAAESPLSFDSLKELDLVKSVVYETLRLNPPVPLQFGRARRDFRLSSHDSAFDVKKGELLCGYQPLVMRDAKVFSEPESFEPDRFRNDKGLLDYLYWSNGPQTGSPTESNKQCAAKDFVTMTACLIVAETFRRYDSISGSAGSITAVQKAK